MSNSILDSGAISDQTIEYDSPIKPLYDSIIEAFEDSNEPTRSRIKDAGKHGLINSAIFIDPSSNPISTPRAHSSKEIQLQDTYLSYLWAYCYSMIGIQEVTFDYYKPEDGIALLEASERLKQLQLTLDWGSCLNDLWRIWPDFIPQPTSESDQVKLTNELFLHTIRYLMYHEAAHLILHSNSFDLAAGIKSGALASNEDLRRFTMMEIQADEFAYNSLFGASDNEALKYMKTLGAIIAHLSSFLLLRSSNTRSRLHPDMDKRLRSVMLKANVNTEPFVTYLHFTIIVGLQVFLNKHSPEHYARLVANGPYDTFDELERDLFQIIEELKS